MSDKATNESTADEKPEKKARQRWQGSRKRMSMPAAMRTVGLDEIEVAMQLDELVTKVVESDNDKLRFEVLRDCAKLLDAYPGSQDAQAEAPRKIVIDIPRPPREIATTGSTDASAHWKANS